MAKLSTGQTYGTTSRVTSQRLLGGEAQIATGAPLAQAELGQPGLQPQASPVSTFQQAGAPTLGGPLRMFEPPALPRPSQDLANLADALSGFNKNLQQYATSMEEVKMYKEAAAKERGTALGAELSRFGYKDYAEALRETEKKAQIDPSLGPLLQRLKANDPRALPYANNILNDSFIKLRVSGLRDEINNMPKLPDGRSLDAVSPDDAAFTDYYVSSALPPGMSPKAILDNQAALYDTFGAIRKDQTKRYIAYKDGRIRAGYQAGLGGDAALLAAGQLNPNQLAASVTQRLTDLQNSSSPALYQEQKKATIKHILDSVIVAAGGSPSKINQLALPAAKALELIQAGPNGELLIDQLDQPRDVVILDFYRGLSKGTMQDRELQDKQATYRGQDAADADAKAYLTPEVLNNPAQLQARLDALPQEAVRRFPNDPQAQQSYSERVQSYAKNYTRTYIAPIQRDNAANEHANQALNPSTNPVADIQRYERMFRNREIDESDFNSLVAGAKARNEKRNDNNYNTLRGLQRDLQARLTEQFRLPTQGDGTPVVTAKEAIEIRKQMANLYRDGEQLIIKNPGANIDAELGKAFEKYIAPAVQKGQQQSQQPKAKTPEDISRNFGPGRGNAADNANLRRQTETVPLYDRSRIGQQLDEILTNKPLDNATRQIIRRTGLKPSDFFIIQMKLHGVPLTPEIQQKLRTLDGSDLVSQALPASGESSGGMGLMLPNVSRAQRLWDVFNSGVQAARNTAMATGLNLGGGNFNFEKPSSVVYERPGKQPGVDYFFESKKFPAVLGGRVKDVGREPGYGNYVVVESIDPLTGKGVDVLYGHLPNNGIYVKRGQNVQAGEIIGKQGGTGNVSSVDGTIASVDFFAVAPEGSKSMTPYSGFDQLRRYVTNSLQNPKARPASPKPVGNGLEGKATYYLGSGGNDGVAGGLTANGETYNPKALTAAVQWSLRNKYMNKWVKVEDMDTGKTVRVWVNDVGQMGGNEKSFDRKDPRIIDLSPAAFKKLFGGLGKGVGDRIRIEIDPNQTRR